MCIENFSTLMKSSWVKNCQLFSNSWARPITKHTLSLSHRRARFHAHSVIHERKHEIRKRANDMVGKREIRAINFHNCLLYGENFPSSQECQEKKIACTNLQMAAAAAAFKLIKTWTIQTIAFKERMKKKLPKDYWFQPHNTALYCIIETLHSEKEARNNNNRLAWLRVFSYNNECLSKTLSALFSIFVFFCCYYYCWWRWWCCFCFSAFWLQH